jgi:hypothetical protein
LTGSKPYGSLSGTIVGQGRDDLKRCTWINGRRWDLTWLIGSAVVVPIGILIVWWGAPSDAMNLAVTALVGGPHLFSTYVTTYFDPRFRRSHGPALAVITVAVPAFVIWMGLCHFQWLMSFFVLWASLHVLQQNAYLTDVYRRRAGDRDPAWSRYLDYAVLFLSFYPIASYKIVHDDFLLGGVKILMPPLFKSDVTPAVILVLFTAAAAAWVLKTVVERRRGTLNGPKTLLIGVTSTLAFLLPCAATGERLELVFQTVNAWHSIQYLGVIWLVLALRKQRGQLDSPVLRRISGPGRAAVAFYGTCFFFTAAHLTAVFGVIRWDPLGVSNVQYYYMGVLSVLFIHYALDTYLFFAATREEARPDTIPHAVPSQG